MKIFIACVSLLAGNLLSLSGNPISDILDWNKCTTLKNSEIIDIILGWNNKYYSKNECLSNGILHINTENGNKGKVSLTRNKWFKTEPINDSDIDSVLKMFRSLELSFIAKIGPPAFFHKQGANTSRETSLLLMKRGKIEYRTEWNMDKKRLILLLSGEDLALYIKIFYK